MSSALIFSSDNLLLQMADPFDKLNLFAGLDRTDFLLALAREGQDAFVVAFADLEKELKRG